MKQGIAMKLILKVVLWTVCVYAGLMLATGLGIKAMLSGSRIQQLFATLNQRVPVTISAQGGTFDLQQWFLFRPVVTLDGLSIANPPGFPAQPLLTARQVGAQVALSSMLKKEFEIVRVSLTAPEVNIDSDVKGNTNLGLLLAGLAKGGGAKASDSTGDGVAIRSLSITSGTVHYAAQAGGAALTIRDIELKLADFSADSTCRLILGATLFGGRASRLDFEGRLGPFTATSVPAQGNLSVALAPVEFPPAFRKTYFGDVLSDPGSRSKASFRTTLQGDFAGRLSGEGMLELAGFELGPTAGKRLALHGQAPLRITIREAMKSPSFELISRGASLTLGQGQWKGSVETRFDGSRIQGQSSGSIGGVRIEELLQAFTTTKNSVSGMAEIPKYNLLFAGKDANQIRDSLAGDGSIKLQQGRVAMFDLLGSVENKIKNVMGGETTASGATDFIGFDSRFQIRNGQLLLSDILLKNASSSVSGQGRVGFDHSLEFDLITGISGSLATRLGGRPDASGQAQLRVPVKVRGTLEAAKVYPDVAGMAKAQAVEKGMGLLDSFLKKRTAAQPK
jgi:uncharacterized protein involved in outer membrane biogenesis